MIYLLTGVVILVAVYRHKALLPKILRYIGFIYLAMAVLQAVTGNPVTPVSFAGLGIYDAIIYLVLGTAFIVFGTKEIRMPSDDVVEDDLSEEYNPLTH